MESLQNMEELTVKHFYETYKPKGWYKDFKYGQVIVEDMIGCTFNRFNRRKLLLIVAVSPIMACYKVVREQPNRITRFRE